MRILVIGSGGREHALVWKLSQSSLVQKIYCAPGNAGIAQLAECVEHKPEDIGGLCEFALHHKIDLTVVGPEQPLVLGIVDLFEQNGLKVFGPRKEAALIEGSKAYAKEFMLKYHIPTASFKIFDQPSQALDFALRAAFPVVIKADGLASGKGAFIVEDYQEAQSVIQKMMNEKIFGPSGLKIVIEDFLEGEEISILAFTDGKNIVPMLSAQDHKRAFDGDRGPNTGGMGAYAPTKIVNEKVMGRIKDEILEPTCFGLSREGRPFKGVLYTGLMMTESGPKVLEYNCRWGDPEAQVILPLLKNDVAELFFTIVNEELWLEKIEWKGAFAVCVVLATLGYPETFEKGKEIWGLDRIEANEAIVFHAGTKLQDKKILTNGGRILGVTSVADSLEKAVWKAYGAIDKIRFDGMQYRRDIGYKAIQNMKPA